MYPLSNLPAQKKFSHPFWFRLAELGHHSPRLVFEPVGREAPSAQLVAALVRQCQSASRLLEHTAFEWVQDRFGGVVDDNTACRVVDIIGGLFLKENRVQSDA